MVKPRYLVLTAAGDVDHGYVERSQARLAAQVLADHRQQPMRVYDLLTRRSWTVESRQQRHAA